MVFVYILRLPKKLCLFLGLFVVVSWVSFLIPPEIVPGRMAMLVTLFLCLINIFNIVTTGSPNTEGMTAIAAWVLVCIFFVFGALLGEYARSKSLGSIQLESSFYFDNFQVMHSCCGKRSGPA